MKRKCNDTNDQSKASRKQLFLNLLLTTGQLTEPWLQSLRYKAQAKNIFIGGSKNYKIQSRREGESDSEENSGNCDVDGESEIDNELESETFTNIKKVAEIEYGMEYN